VKLLLASHGGEGRMRLDVTLVVGTYCSGILDWRYCLVFLISCLPDVLEKDLSSYPSGWTPLWCSKPIVAIVAAVLLREKPIELYEPEEYAYEPYQQEQTIAESVATEPVVETIPDENATEQE